MNDPNSTFSYSQSVLPMTIPKF